MSHILNQLLEQIGDDDDHKPFKHKSLLAPIILYPKLHRK
jgi:hypothetical protein